MNGISLVSFTVTGFLGKGTFGKVLRVNMKSDPSNEFALKVLSKQFLLKNQHLKYAISECNIMRRCSHPFVLKMHYSFQTPDNLFMVLDLCPGGDLSYHLERREFFQEKDAKFFIAEVVLAIEYIHSLDVIYRDLKPENILIDKDGHVKLADFGLAKEGIRNNNAKSFCGSPAYLAPEMLTEAGVGKPADIYQLGAVLYELLLGITPFYTNNIKKLYNSIQNEKLQIPTILSKEAADLLTRQLNKNPKNRIKIGEVKQHPFFREIDWDLLYKKQLKLPIHLKTEDYADNEEA